MAEIDVGDAGDRNRPGPRIGRLVMLLALVFVAASGTAVVIPLVRAATDPGPARVRVVTARIVPAGRGPAPGATDICVEDAAKPHCARVLADLAGRIPLGTAGRAAATIERDRLEAIMPPGGAGPCEYDKATGVCSMGISPQAARQVSHALARAGYPAAVVRTARADDPAPVGSLLVAVPVGPACVLIYDDGDGPQSWPAGQLPEGVCLRP